MKRRVLGAFLFFLGIHAYPLSNTTIIGAKPVAIES